jgi:hypothetical protein
LPFLEHSAYPGPPFWQFNGHLQTLVPGALRHVRGVRYQRERIETPDGDFLDLDWLRRGHDRLVLLTHGLEGSSQGQYIRGTAKLFAQHGWDALAWNCRSCSGEMNRRFRLYHHGDTEDIGTVIGHALASGQYRQLTLVGYSMGGNITLKYLGTQGTDVPPELRAAVAFSAPCDIAAGADVLDRWDNFVYKIRFLGLLGRKIRQKSAQFPGRIEPRKLRQVRRWRDFDEWFSAPLTGHASAEAFHQQASAKNFLEGIRVPTLLVSAANDPILTPDCFPIELARQHPFFHFELPRSGGHCGFRARGGGRFSWSEHRALEFCTAQLRGT